VHNYYTCKDVWKKKGCKKKNIKKEYIENFILEKAREQLTDDNIVYISKIIAEISKRDNNTPIIADIKKKLKDNAAAVENLMIAIEHGGANLDLISERISQKRKEKAELEKVLAHEQWEKTEISEDDIGTFFYRLKNGDENNIIYKRALISIFINSVYLYDNKATIFFNCTDRPVEMDYNILNEADSNSDITHANAKFECSYIEASTPPI
jgi:hypothetical protein